MNTRLRVETVTECVTGRGSVARQLDIAEGRLLDGPEPHMTGHAIEARLLCRGTRRPRGNPRPADWRDSRCPVGASLGLLDNGIRLDSGSSRAA